MWALTAACSLHRSPPFASHSAVCITASFASRSVYAERGHFLAQAAGQLHSALHAPDIVRARRLEKKLHGTKRNETVWHGVLKHCTCYPFGSWPTLNETNGIVCNDI